MALTMWSKVEAMLASIVICLMHLIVQGAKLNSPQVLLPYYSSVIMNFTLFVEYSPDEAQIASCYQWRSTRPEIASISLINSTDGVCAQTVVVSAISRSPNQMTTVILAENKVTGEVLRTNVITGDIVRLEIETTARILYLEDAPEELVARGFDSEGNIFSSLEGLLFEWSLVLNEMDHDIIDARTILRIKKFSDSHYTTPRHIAPLEDQGLQGDRILVEGIQTGTGKLSAKLKDPAYKNVKPNDVQMMVIANLMLSPSNAYVLTHGHVKYKVELLKNNLISQIKMPSKQYYLEIKDKNICRLDAQTSTATALAIGSTEVLLKDKNIVTSEFFHQPSAMIHVVNPATLEFVVLPHKKWVLETGREYEIYIEIYDSDSHKVYPSDNVRVTADFPEQYLKVLYSSQNGTYHRVKAVLKGNTDIQGVLVCIVDNDGHEHVFEPEVKKTQKVQIYDPISLIPAQIFFPWDPVTKCVHTFTIQATGGSGEYLWSTAEVDVASVTSKGQVRTVGPGKCNITASDVKNTAYAGVSNVYVLPPSHISFPPSVVEAAVNTELLLPLSVFAKFDEQIKPFLDCRQLILNITFSDGSVFDYVPPGPDVPADLPENGCMFLTLLAKRQGHTEITATYRSKNVILQTTATIAAFNPLKTVDPETEAVVALGSSKEVVFVGGPQPWVLDSSKFYRDLNPLKDQVVRAERPLSDTVIRGTHVFVLTCLGFGEQEVQLVVGNGKTAKNQFPVSATASVRLICARPVELHLVPNLKVNPHLPPCPVSHENNMPVPVHYGTDLDLIVTVTDASGRRFDNFSSLAVDWTVSAPSLAEFVHVKDLRMEIESSDGKMVSAHQTLKPHRKTGSITVTASVFSYKNWATKAVLKQQEKITPTISKSLELVLVEEASLSPLSVSVFNHPSNKVNISVHHGSGYFHVEDIPSQVIIAKYDHKKRAVEITPVKDGSQSLTVYDLCIDLPTHPVASVSVSGVSSIQVMVIDKVEVTKEVVASVQVLDLKGKPLLASFFSLMDLQLEADLDIVSLRSANRSIQENVTKFYVVFGAVVGHTTLTATVKLPTGQVIYSTPKPIEVFPPLRLDPKNIFLIIGSMFQVLATGGPQSQSNVEFSIMDSRVSTVTSGGLIDAIEIGTTRVVGESVGTDPSTGKKIIYSQDEAAVNVVILKGIRIHVPLTRLQTGAQMPVYAVGLTENETPFMFASSVSPLKFIWSVSNREVLSLQSVYHKGGIIPNSENNFAQQAIATEPGHVIIKLKVEVTPNSHFQFQGDGVLQDDVQIQVFERLTLLSPELCHGHVYITPNTDTFIKTNRDQAARVRYLTKESKSDSPVVQLLANGHLRSGSVPGKTILHVIAEEEFGLNQSLAILVIVKPVSYLMLNLDTAIQTSYPGQLSHVPIGSMLQFSVSFHDDVGDRFYATNIQLGIRCSRYDLIQLAMGADNNTLVMRAAEAGTTILKVWDKAQPTVVDYVMVPVASAITPVQASITLGSIICFSSPIIADKGVSGRWKSKSEHVAIDEDSGIGVGTGVGHSTIVYSFSLLTSTKTEVSVEPITSVSIDPGVGFITNSVSRGKSQFFSVSFSDGDNIVGTNCSSVVTKTSFYPQFIPYLCHLELNLKSLEFSTEDLFTVAAHFHKDKGLHGCLVTPNPTSSLSQLIATLDATVSLKARVPPFPGQPEIVSSPITLDFLPAFYVHNPEVHLTTISLLSSIRVSSSVKIISDIQVTTSDPNLIQVQSPERDSSSENVIMFPVRLLDSLTLWEKDHLDLYVDLMHQRSGHTVRIPVFVKLIGQKPDISYVSYRQDLSWSNLMAAAVHNYQSWFIICLLLVFVAGATLVGYHAIVGPSYKTTSNPNVFLSPSGVQSSPSFIKQHPSLKGSPTYPGPVSPSSPKLWSVSYKDTRSSPYKRVPYSLTPKS